MDLNLVVLCGRVAAEPEYRQFGSGSSLIRILVTVRSDTPRRRIDLIPVVLRDPPDTFPEECLIPGARIWVTGMVQRRFGETTPTGERRSRLEVLAHDVTLKGAKDDLVTV